MKIVYTKQELKQIILKAKETKKKIGFVPTMGYLHDGHISLIEIAKNHCDFVVSSIFVNPLQFNSQEDLEKYPRDINRDLRMLKDKEVDVVFIPNTKEMYEKQPKISLDIPKLTNKLCGKFRPGHFQGVLLVVLKLFILVEPDYAFFGKKDYQQYLIIKQMVEDLELPIQIIGCPLIREKNGLAMSSRNVRLSEKGIQDATLIYRALTIAKQQWEKGENNTEVLKEIIKDIIETGSLNKVEYIEIVNKENLEPVEIVTKNSLIAVAVYTENVRLIDNIELDLTYA